MGAVEKHPTDEGKYQATFSDYGHGEGNGRSRSAVYKEFKKFGKTSEKRLNPERAAALPPEPDQISQNRAVEDSEPESPDFVQDDDDSIPPADFVQDEWTSVAWADGDDENDGTTHTIPRPVSRLAKTRKTELDTESTGQVIRFAFVAVDRMLTHWGRGVMTRPEWAINRSPEDYDALESSSVALLNHYGVAIPVSPLLVWSATVGSAYAPPITHIVRNADPNRKRGGLLRRLNPLGWFRRRKRRPPAPSPSAEEVIPVEHPDG